MNHYHNPHAHLPVVHGQRPIQHPMQVQHGHPAQQNPGYSQPPQYQSHPQQPQQPPYWMTEQAGYQPGQGAPGANLQLINTPQGVMVMDPRTGTILGPVNQPQPVQARPAQHSQPFQGNIMQPSHHNQPQEHGSGFTDNRYGNAGGLIKSKDIIDAPIGNMVDVVDVPTTQVKAPVKAKVKTLATGYIPTYRNKPFTVKDVVFKETSLVGPSLEHLVFEVIDKAHAGDQEELVWVQSGVVVQKFYKTTLIEKEEELYQTSIEKVYRAMKRIAPDISNVHDFVYFQAYNTWLTQCVNTFLSIHMKDTLIDSFIEDFNLLVKFLIVDHDHVREQLVEHMAEALEHAVCDIGELRATDDENPEPLIKTDESIIPEHLTLIYMKIFSAEMGDDASESGLRVANKILGSLKELIGKSSFMLITMDRRFYRVTVMNDGDVSIDCIRE